MHVCCLTVVWKCVFCRLGIMNSELVYCIGVDCGVNGSRCDGEIVA